LKTAKQKTQTYKGCVEQMIFSAPDYSVGELRTADKKRIKFVGKFAASVGDHIVITGKWENHSRGPQIAV